MLRIQIEDDCFSLKRKKCLVEGEHEEKKRNEENSSHLYMSSL